MLNIILRDMNHSHPIYLVCKPNKDAIKKAKKLLPLLERRVKEDGFEDTMHHVFVSIVKAHDEGKDGIANGHLSILSLYLQKVGENKSATHFLYTFLPEDIRMEASTSFDYDAEADNVFKSAFQKPTNLQ